MLTLGAGATGGLYFLIRRHEQREVRWTTRIAAASVRADISDDIQLEIAGVVRLATLASRISSSEQAWKENAGLYIKTRPDCIAIEELTRAYQRRSIVYAREGQLRDIPFPLAEVPLELLKVAAEFTKPVISPFVAMGDESIQRLTVMPIDAQGDSGGFVVAFYDGKASFDRILADIKDLGFSVAILESGQEQ